MKDTISLTVPMEYSALIRASDMLNGLALDLNKEQPATLGASLEDKQRAAVLEQITTAPGASATDQFVAEQGGQELDPLVFAASPANSAAATDTLQPGSPTPNTTTPTETVTPAQDATAPAGVTLANGVPWDHRIHASSKLTLSKAPHGWKMKRNVDKALVEQVEAELRAAMAAGPANPVVIEQNNEGDTIGGDCANRVNNPVVAVNPAPAAVNPAPAAVNPAPAAVNPAPAAVNPAPAAGITEFPALMGAITSAGIDEGKVLAAVNAQGLTALVMLSARPDLIPAVAKALGV